MTKSNEAHMRQLAVELIEDFEPDAVQSFGVDNTFPHNPMITHFSPGPQMRTTEMEFFNGDTKWTIKKEEPIHDN